MFVAQRVVRLRVPRRETGIVEPSPAFGRGRAAFIGPVVGAVGLASAVGVLAGLAPVALVAVALALGTAVVVWQFPAMVLLGLLAVRVAVPNFEAPNLAIGIGGAIGLLLAVATLPPKRVVVPLAGYVLLAFATMPWQPTIDVDQARPLLVLPLVDLPYFPRAWLGVREWARILSLLVVLWLAFDVVARGLRLDRVIAAVLVSGSIAVLVGGMQAVTGDTFTREGFEGITGPFAHPSHFAHYLLVVLAVGIVALMRSRPGFAQLAIAGVLAGSAAALYLTFSRAAWLGFLIIVAALALFQYRRILVVAALALPITLALAPGVVATAEQRFADLSAGSGGHNTNSWNWRKDHWERMVPYGMEQPVLGRGFATYHSTTVDEYGRVLDVGGQAGSDEGAPRPADRIVGINAHNDFLKAFIENGIVGVVLWCGVFVGAMSALWTTRRTPTAGPYAIALLSLIVALLFVSSGDNVRDNTVAMLYLFAVLGAVLGAAHRDRTRERLQPEPAAAVGPPLQFPESHGWDSRRNGVS